MIDTKFENAVASLTPEFFVLPILQALTEDKHTEMLRDYSPRLSTTLGQLGADTQWVELLWWGLRFLELNGRNPQSVGAILEWFMVNPGLIRNVGLRENTQSSLEEQAAYFNEYDIPEHKALIDLEVHLQRFIEVGRQRYHASHHKVAAGLASGDIVADLQSSDPDIKDVVGLSLPEQARVYINRKMAADPFLSAAEKGIQGDLTENLSNISDHLDAALRPQAGQRLLTGIKVIDDNMVIGPIGMLWIGILATLGSGKSTFLKTMLLEFARQGARILFVPREERAESAMASLIWANAFEAGIRNLPSLVQWFAAPGEITPENQIAKDEAIAAWNKLPGQIEIIQKETLAEIMDHYETHKARKQYTVLAIDYVAHLKVQKGRGDSEQDPHKRDFETLQAFALREGVVTITPLQANREGTKLARAGEGEDEGVFTNCEAVEYYSAASQGMDVVFGVWYRGEFKENDIMRMSNPKPPRSGIGFHKIDLRVDPITRRVREVTAKERMEIQERENEAYLRKLRARDRGGRRAIGGRGERRDPADPMA